MTILRDPTDNFISSWRYYNGMYKDMRKLLPMYKTNDFIEGKGTVFKYDCTYRVRDDS